VTIQIEVLHIPECAHVDAARQLLLDCLEDLGLPRTAVVETTGPFPSPSIVVNGTDVMGAPEGMSFACRLDVPTRDRVLAALRPLVGTGASRPDETQGVVRDA
jgi:hypothetical protein